MPNYQVSRYFFDNINYPSLSNDYNIIMGSIYENLQVKLYIIVRFLKKCIFCRRLERQTAIHKLFNKKLNNDLYYKIVLNI